MSRFDSILSNRRIEPEPKPEEKIRMTFRLAKRLHRKLKKRAVDDERDMADILAEALELWFEKNAPG